MVIAFPFNDLQLSQRVDALVGRAEEQQKQQGSKEKKRDSRSVWRRGS
jgi:hypothetical protein